MINYKLLSVLLKHTQITQRLPGGHIEVWKTTCLNFSPFQMYEAILFVYFRIPYTCNNFIYTGILNLFF